MPIQVAIRVYETHAEEAADMCDPLVEIVTLLTRLDVTYRVFGTGPFSEPVDDDVVMA